MSPSQREKNISFPFLTAWLSKITRLCPYTRTLISIRNADNSKNQPNEKKINKQHNKSLKEVTSTSSLIGLLQIDMNSHQVYLSDESWLFWTSTATITGHIPSFLICTIRIAPALLLDFTFPFLNISLSISQKILFKNNFEYVTSLLKRLTLWTVYI